MARKPEKPIQDLPQTGDTWVLVFHQLRAWVESADGPPGRPYQILIYNLDQDQILGNEILAEPSLKRVRSSLFQTIRSPKYLPDAVPQRPARVIFEEPALLEELGPDLEVAGIQAGFQPRLPVVDDLIGQLETYVNRGRPPLPGLLEDPGISVEMAARFFSAAAAFYRAAPWIHLKNEDILAVKVPPQAEPIYVLVMGHGGIEYGLAHYYTWAEAERMLYHEVQPDEAQSITVHTLLFNEASGVAFDDLEQIERFGWEIVDERSIPLPFIFTPEAGLQRPGPQELRWYEAVLTAVPRFLSGHLLDPASNQLRPAEAVIPVDTSAGRVEVWLKFPAAELSPGRRSAVEWDYGSPDAEAEKDLDWTFGQLDLEAQLFELTFGMGGGPLGEAAEQAQRLMYRAWLERNPARRINLAHQALEISPDCADAYVLLAQEEADTLQRSLDFYRQGVAAGERALGPNFVREKQGDFWMLVETRPYMRALEGLAGALWRMDEEEQAVAVYRQMLELAPSDSQGMRYLLLELLLDLGREAAARQLIGSYRRDLSATWMFTRALLRFRRSGTSSSANRALREALVQNPYVADYLTGKERIPKVLPAVFSLGDEAEAVLYAAAHLNPWRRTPGAIDWLESRLSG